MIKTLAQLKSEAGKLGLCPKSFTGRGGKEAKRDWVKVLGDYHQHLQYGCYPPWALTFRRNMESPMLSYRFSDLKPCDQEKIFTSDDWVLEDKINGVRMLLFYTNSGKFAYSRNTSVVDFLPVNYSDKIPFPDILRGSLILDCEVMCSSSEVIHELAKRSITAETQLDATNMILHMNTKESLEVQAKYPLIITFFDVLYERDTLLFETPWCSRRTILEIVIPPEKRTDLIKLCPVTKTNKEAYIQSVFDRGDEGVVAKNIYSRYRATESRGKDWVKIKRSMSNSIRGSFQDEEHIDAYVSGFEPGNIDSGWSHLVGSLIFSVSVLKDDNTEYTHEIAKVSAFTMEDRIKMTVLVDGKVSLHPDYYGKVYEINGQDVSAKSKRLSHAVIVRPRPDRSEFECIMLESDIAKAIL